jgi:hypothetical protein
MSPAISSTPGGVSSAEGKVMAGGLMRVQSAIAA